ncbi:MAG: glycosyltransferase family 39 protein, partial [Microgenomates group bacterium]
MGQINRVFRYFCIILICFGIYLSLQYVAHGDIIFHTDIARDFMLMQEMWENGKPSLIGAKIGPVQGLFHGPLWLYLNMPAFILGHGNPVVVGWGWVVMEVIFLISTYYIVKEIFSQNAALLASLFIASRLAFTSHQLFNPSGAIMLTPLMFYLLWKYFKDHKSRYLIYLSLVLGCIIQFEAAYGVPMTILSFIAVVFESMRLKKYFHFLYLSAILLPLSTYIIFDLRHNFIQFSSLLTYITSSKTVGLPFGNFLLTRLNSMIDASFGFLAPSPAIWGKIIFLIFPLLVLVKGSHMPSKSKIPYVLYSYLFFGFWLIACFYPGKVEG